MQINRLQINIFHPVQLVAALFFLWMVVAGPGDGWAASEENIVASGDDFVMTLKTVDAYNAFFVSQKLRWSREEVIKTALKYELLSREYRKKQDSAAIVADRAADSDKVEARMLDGKKYIQGLLESWVVSDTVIESYYRSNPEKYIAGKAPDGKITTRPLDDAQKDEIRFKIIEGKKEVIVKEFVDSLISKYHIVTNNGV